LYYQLRIEAILVFTVKSYSQSLKSNLENHSQILIEKLKEIQTFTFSTEIDLIDFTAFIEPTNFELSITMFSMDEDANEVFDEGTDSTVFAGSVDILEDVIYHQVPETQEDTFDDFYEENGEELEEVEKQIFANWFSACWKKANGQAFSLPAYFCTHDDDSSFDLQKNVWIPDEEKWAE